MMLSYQISASWVDWNSDFYGGRQQKKRQQQQLIDFRDYLALSSSWNWAGLSWKVVTEVDQQALVQFHASHGVKIKKDTQFRHFLQIVIHRHLCWARTNPLKILLWQLQYSFTWIVCIDPLPPHGTQYNVYLWVQSAICVDQSYREVWQVANGSLRQWSRLLVNG